MAKSVSVIGVDPGELPWLRLLLFLLRHPDPVISGMVQQTLRYLAENAHPQAEAAAAPLDHAG